MVAVDGPAGLVAQQQEPLRIFDTFQAQSVTQAQPDKWVYDFGQNASGIIEIQVKGQRGDTVRITPAELLGTEVKAAFNAMFFNSSTKQYATGSQAANAMAVYMGECLVEF